MNANVTVLRWISILTVIETVNNRQSQYSQPLGKLPKCWRGQCRVLAVMLIIGLFASAELFGSAPIPGVILIVSLLGVALLTMLNLTAFGTNVESLFMPGWNPSIDELDC